MSRYQIYYKQIICQDLLLKNNFSSVFELPKLNKIVINTTSKKYIQDKKHIIPTLLAFELISGQTPKLTYAQKSLANFKVRQGQIIGCKITLRSNRMYMFLDSFTTVVLPKFRDFLGISKKSINRFGNFSIGLENLILFPELENHFDFFEITKGLNINLISNVNSIQNSNILYSALQLPEK